MDYGIMATLILRRMRWEETQSGRACGADVAELDPIEALLKPCDEDLESLDDGEYLTSEEQDA